MAKNQVWKGNEVIALKIHVVTGHVYLEWILLTEN
jgi:hypothetical protein